MDMTEKKISSRLHYSGRIIKVYNDEILDPAGNTAYREYCRHPGGICVVPLTDQGEVLLVRQYRYPYGEEVVEIPAGKRDSATENPEEGGRRELREELGAEAEHFIPLGIFYPTPGYTDEVLYMYAATGLTFGEAAPDEGEFVEPLRYHIDTLTDMIMKGEIRDGKTQTAVLKVKHLLDRGEIKLK